MLKWLPLDDLYYIHMYPSFTSNGKGSLVSYYMLFCTRGPYDGSSKNNLCGSFYGLPIFNGLPVIPGFALKLKSY